MNVIKVQKRKDVGINLHRMEKIELNYCHIINI